MITLNGKKFAKNDEEFSNSLFECGGTCVGFYRVNKRSISLLDMNKNKIGVINRHGVLGSARKLDNGKYWYSYATIDIIGEYSSYMQEVEDISEIMKRYNIK